MAPRPYKTRVRYICPQCGVVQYLIPCKAKKKFCSKSCSNMGRVSLGIVDYDPKLRRDWRNQKMDAKRRGVHFLLKFDEWLQIWKDSDHLHERGPQKDQYVMARFGDKGAYAVGNVKVVLATVNHAEAWARPEQIERHRNRMLGNTRAKRRESSHARNG